MYLCQLRLFSSGFNSVFLYKCYTSSLLGYAYLSYSEFVIFFSFLSEIFHPLYCVNPMHIYDRSFHHLAYFYLTKGMSVKKHSLACIFCSLIFLFILSCHREVAKYFSISFIIFIVLIIASINKVYSYFALCSGIFLY